MKENGVKIIDKVKAIKNYLIILCIKGIILKAKCMDKVYSNGIMETFMMDNLDMDESKEEEFGLAMREIHIQDNGK